MKHVFTLFTTTLLSLSLYAQGYEYGIVHNGGYGFTVVATPNFDAVDTDISDIGFTLMLPTGNADVINTDQFDGRSWTATEVTATQLNNLSLGDGTRDGFVMNLPPGQTLLSHTNGVSFPLVTFEVSNMPTAGEIELLPNSDPIAQGLGGTLDSFYNSNIDSTSTQDYFVGFTSGMENFSFSTLDIEEVSEVSEWVRIYPNPVSVIVTIKTEATIDRLALYNALGQLVLSEQGNTKQINVQALKSGIYILKIHSGEGTVSKRLIVK